MAHAEPKSPATATPTLRELALLFLRLGVTAFGGPAAHIAIMEHEIVQRRGWLTRAEFLDLIAAANLIPGPNSTEVAIHVGRRAGWAGLIVAGVCFILPAALIVAALGWGYVEFGAVPAVTGLLFGVKPVVIAVVVQALARFAHSSLKSLLLVGVALFAAGVQVCNNLHLLTVDEVAILLGCGLLVAVARHLPRRAPRSAGAALSPMLIAGVGPAAVPAAASVGLWPLFLVFLKIGSVLFGSGYVLLAFLRTDLVVRRGWLTEDQLIDAVAVGQVTPGPVFTTATFIGYLLAGPAGAAVATVGIFLPAFVFVALSSPLIPRLRRSPTAGAFLDGVVVASLALMAVVTWDLGRAALLDFNVSAPRFWIALAVFGASLFLLVRYRVSSAWLVLAGGVVGVVAGEW